MATRRTPAATAKLLLINSKLYEKERDREITRYRFSLATLRKVSRRKALRQSFLDELDEELEELGWMLLRFGAEFAVMDLSKTESWVKLSSKRLSDAEYATMEGEEVDAAFEELFPERDEPQDE